MLDEFLDAKEVVAGLAAEYEACERSDYVSGCCRWLFVLGCLQLMHGAV